MITGEKTMRKAILLALALAIGGACTAEESPIQTNPYSDISDAPAAWTPQLKAEVRRAFFSGYGAPDAFGNCAINFIISDFTPAEIEAKGEEAMTLAALSACGHLIN